MKTLHEQWLGMCEAIQLTPEKSPVQYREMQKAFYAGATVALNAMLDLTEDDVTEEAGVVGLDALHNECQEFGLKVIRDAQMARAKKTK